jgi:hypothetical protein
MRVDHDSGFHMSIRTTRLNSQRALPSSKRPAFFDLLAHIAFGVERDCPFGLEKDLLRRHDVWQVEPRTASPVGVAANIILILEHTWWRHLP